MNVMKKAGTLLTVLSGIIFGIVPLLVSIVYSYGFNAINVGFYRYLLAIPFLYVMVRFKKRSFKVAKIDMFHIIIIATIGNTITSLLLNLSYTYISIGMATTLHFMYPLFVSLMCVFIYKDKLTKTKIISLIIALIGVFMFIDLSKTSGITGMVMALISGVSYAFYMVYMDKSRLMNYYDPLVISFWLNLITTINFGIICLLSNNFVFTLDLIGNMYLIFIALLSQIFAVLFLQIGIKYIGSGNAAMYSLFEPLTSTIVGIIFLHDSITAFKVIGSILIIVAVYLLSIANKKKI